MAKVIETWHLWDDQHKEREWQYLVTFTTKKGISSLYNLCVGRFNGCCACDGTAKNCKTEEWFVKGNYSKIKIISFERFKQQLESLVRL